MAYNRYSNVGGGYPTGSNNIYNQPMPPMQPHQHHPHPQYPPYNRNSAGWNMQPGPPLPPQGQGINPWVNNNIPQSFRGYNPMHDNRNHMNMNKPNLRLSQINKRPNDWNNTPNKRPRTIGGNNLNNSTPNNNKQQPPAQQNLNTTNPKIKKTWVNYNNKNRNFKRRNNNREVKINDKTQDKTPAKKEVPVENVTVSGSDSSTEFDSLQAKHFKSVSGFLCSLCDVFLKDKKCAIEHSKAEPHQTKFKEFKENEEKAKAEAEKAEAEKKAEEEKKAKEATEESKVVDSSGEISAPNTNGTEQNGQEALDDSKAGDANESTLIDDSAVLSSTDTTLDTSKGPQEATPKDAPSLNALNSEDVIALADESTVSEVAESDEVQPVANRGGKGPRGRGRGRSRGRGRR